MWIGNYLAACASFVFVLCGQGLYSDDGLESQIELIKSEVSYCKYLTLMMESYQLSPELGLPWVYEILYDIELKLDELQDEES